MGLVLHFSKGCRDCRRVIGFKTTRMALVLHFSMFTAVKTFDIH